MITVLVTSVGLAFSNAELLWIRSYDQEDTVQMMVGSSIQRFHQYQQIFD